MHTMNVLATTFVFLASRHNHLTVRAFTSPFPSPLSNTWCRFSALAAADMAASRDAGPRQALIEDRLRQAFAPTFLDVQNTSHGRKSDESHFKVVVVSEKFAGTRLVGRHRAINHAIAEENGGLGFHSLEIGAAKTPEEWENNSVVRPSPKCQGGDGRGMTK